MWRAARIWEEHGLWDGVSGGCGMARNGEGLPVPAPTKGLTTSARRATRVEVLMAIV